MRVFLSGIDFFGGCSDQNMVVGFRSNDVLSHVGVVDLRVVQQTQWTGDGSRGHCGPHCSTDLKVHVRIEQNFGCLCQVRHCDPNFHCLRVLRSCSERIDKHHPEGCCPVSFVNFVICVFLTAENCLNKHFTPLQ